MQKKLTDFSPILPCWTCQLDKNFGYEHCLKCDNSQNCDNKPHDWYPIKIEGIKCERCWNCGKTKKVK